MLGYQNWRATLEQARSAMSYHHTTSGSFGGCRIFPGRRPGRAASRTFHGWRASASRCPDLSLVSFMAVTGRYMPCPGQTARAWGMRLLILTISGKRSLRSPGHTDETMLSAAAAVRYQIFRDL